MTENTETSVTVTDPNFIVDLVINDKLEYNGARLLSDSQNKLIKTVKDNNEKQR